MLTEVKIFHPNQSVFTSMLATLFRLFTDHITNWGEFTLIIWCIMFCAVSTPTLIPSGGTPLHAVYRNVRSQRLQVFSQTVLLDIGNQFWPLWFHMGSYRKSPYLPKARLRENPRGGGFKSTIYAV